jgi:hypothetical protein
MSNSRKHEGGHRDHHVGIHQPHHNSHNMNHRKEYKQSTNSSDEESDVSQISRFCFGVLWCFAQVGLWGSVLLFLYWVLKFDKGFAWTNDKKKQFNLHSFLMIVGFIFLNGQAMLIYKTFLCCKKIYNKITHTIFFVLSISIITFGMIVGIQGQHIAPPDQTPVHFYSIHACIGLVTVALFGLQFLVGFVSYLVLLCCEKATAGYRARLLPTHVTMGLIIYGLAIAGCISGLLQTARARLGGPTAAEPEKPDYKNMTNPANPFLNSGIVLNMVGVCLIALGIIMPYIVRNFTQRRNHASFSVN